MLLISYSLNKAWWKLEYLCIPHEYLFRTPRFFAILKDNLKVYLLIWSLKTWSNWCPLSNPSVYWTKRYSHIRGHERMHKFGHKLLPWINRNLVEKVVWIEFIMKEFVMKLYFIMSPFCKPMTKGGLCNDSHLTRFRSYKSHGCKLCDKLDVRIQSMSSKTRIQKEELH